MQIDYGITTERETIFSLKTKNKSELINVLPDDMRNYNDFEATNCACESKRTKHFGSVNISIIDLI